ncbi:hypothetical protein UFOVP529_107 [uncultured Caudovirales phage]|uniref:Uncharacterized protein n=1 Tax=uncultured Caudovirales phage TaxID=2100421 RepID=A0A6J5RJ58_9CAUD|nr:hypothetical protein UFOVP529_107 [uncultured Caudovirales phage]CAB4190246.1 hypothetical protein UFOVP1191_45 [uncultured Caudovirales phage]CAB4194336.1 hypothetical protein UFOVP1252_14 [uncultured Caudovirales phage]
MAKKAQIWSGTAWVDVLSNASQAIYYTSTAPSSANNGDLWIDSDDDMAANQSILDSVTSSSTSSAAASNSVKLAYDAATSTRNILINGAFDVWQRGTSITVGNFTADRWLQSWSAGQSTVASRQSFALGSAPVSGYEGQFFHRCSWSGTASGVYSLSNRIEDVRTFAGQAVTLSFWAKASSATSVMSMAIGQIFGSGGSPSSEVYTVGSAIGLTTSWQRFSQTFNVPSISGKTIGTNLNSYISVAPFYSNATVTGIDFDIWGVQLESGSVATPFARASRTIEQEVASCYRYYYRITPGGTNRHFGFGYLRTATTATVQVDFPVIMRTAPTAIETSGTVTDYSLMYIATAGETGTLNSVVPVIAETSQYNSRITVTVASLAAGATLGSAAFLRAANATAYLGFSAEM